MIMSSYVPERATKSLVRTKVLLPLHLYQNLQCRTVWLLDYPKDRGRATRGGHEIAEVS